MTNDESQANGGSEAGTATTADTATTATAQTTAAGATTAHKAAGDQPTAAGDSGSPAGNARAAGNAGAAGNGSGAESDAAPPPARRRATRARTSKKAVAGATPAAATGAEASPTEASPADADAHTPGSGGIAPSPAEGQLGILFGDDATPEPAVPAKRTRSARKRTAPRAAPRTDDALVVAGPADGSAEQAHPAGQAHSADQAHSAAAAHSADQAQPAGQAHSAAAADPAGGTHPSSWPYGEPATDAVSAPAAAAQPAAAAESPAVPAKKASRSRSRSRKTAAAVGEPETTTTTAPSADLVSPSVPATVGPEPTIAPEPVALAEPDETPTAPAPIGVMPLFVAPEPVAPRSRRSASRPAGPPVARLATPADDEIAPDEGAAAVPARNAGSDPNDLAATVAEQDVEDFDEALDRALDRPVEATAEDLDGSEAGSEDDDEDDTDAEEAGGPGAPARRRRRRGGRGRRGRGRTDAEADEESAEGEAEEEDPAAADADGDAVAASDSEEGEDADEPNGGSSRRRRRRRRRGPGGGEETGPEDPPNTVTKVRESRRDDVTAIRGSTRLEAKKQRRREGREAGKRRSILTEAEFLTRRESVERVMAVRERDGRTQIGVLEDGVLVEHYVARKTQTSTVGNVYLGRVQNVLPSMEAAFIDIGKGRNAVLYAGEVNWDAAGLDGQPRRIEHALKAGESVLVQVTKDPIGHKGSRLTSQISMPGRYLVYVPDGSMTGISRKLPDTERSRLKKILREIVPDDAGVIVRTAAEGASDEELERDVARLRAQWEDISAKIKTVQSPALLYGEPDLAIRVVRDIFNEDFSKLIVSGDDAWDTLEGYVSHVAPDLAPRLERWNSDKDIFAAHRIDEQLAKAMDRKVFLPSGGSLVIDRTEAMTVIDVNTGKFTGSGGNLESTVTENNLEAAEEVVRQLRLRDIGGIIVVDFIDMVLESNRDLVLRRLLECLGRDRTRHQVAEVTSLGLVQMTRKRVGQGLIEVFSETCEHCAGRGIIVHDEPVEKHPAEMSNSGGGGAGAGGGRRRH